MENTLRTCLFLTLALSGASLFAQPARGRIDSLPPVVTVNTASGLYNKSLTLQFTLSEAATVYYTLDGSEPTDKSMEYTGLLNISAEGRTLLRYIAIDLVGNRSRVRDNEYLIDTHAPKADITPPGGLFGREIEAKILVNEPARLFLAWGSAAPREIKETTLKITNSCTLTVQAEDKAGNLGELETVVFTIDRNVPAVTMSHEGGLYDKTFKLALSSAPGVRIYYSYDEFAPLTSYGPYTGPILLKPGQTVVSFYGENSAGTRSDVIKQVYTIDLHAPKVSALIKEEKGGRVLLVRASEKAELRYTLDGSVPTATSPEIQGSIPLPRKGVTVLRVWARDPAGNISDDFEQRFSYDITPPQVKLTPAPGLYNKPFKIAFETNEKARVFYTLDNSLPNTESPVYSAPVPVTKDGRLTLTYYAIDESGNPSEFASVGYALDQTPPKITVKIERDTGQQLFTVTFDKEERDLVYFTLNGSDPDPTSPRIQGPLQVKAGQRLRWYAVDSVGNPTEVRELTEIILPVVKIVPKGGVFQSVQRVTLTANQPGAIFYRMRSKTQAMGDFLEFTEPLLLNANGLYKIEYYTEDRGGNRSVISEESYLIDLFPPEVDVYTQRNLIDSTITLYFQASENVSIYYTLDGTNPFTSPSAGVLCNKYFLSKDKIRLRQSQSLKVSFIAEDIAGNRSEMYQFDVNLPTVFANYPEGRYNEILHVTLTTFNDATIYYTTDAGTPTELSPVYRQPIPITRNTVLRYFAVDQYGYRGEVRGGEYLIDLPPRPEFVVQNPEIIEGMKLTFDASASVDEESESGGLLYRWDFDGDGKFDTDFRLDPRGVTSYRTPGVKPVRLEVRDRTGLVGSRVKPVNVVKDCPRDMTALNDGVRAYCMDRYEYPNRPDSTPQTGFSWVEAVMRCRNAGKELCTFSQWQRACEGRGSWDYPYGPAYNEERCNTEGEGILPSGKRKRCVTSDGVHDLTGNVWEWVADREDGYNLIAGGDFAYGRSARCQAKFPDLLSNREKNVGFRCCK